MQEESQRSINSLRVLAEKQTDMDRKRYIRIKEAVSTYHIGKTKLVDIAKKAGAFLKIDKTVLIDVEAFERYIESFRLPNCPG
ncbi:MAG: hypothetical protein K6A71_07655 [Lachnospiraceae bacterium]|nr:hypothetical protein [Lachnospiraceae bacterium]